MPLTADELLNLHRGQGMDLFWRDSLTCPTEEEYVQMVLGSMWDTNVADDRNGGSVPPRCQAHDDPVGLECVSWAEAATDPATMSPSSTSSRSSSKYGTTT